MQLFQVMSVQSLHRELSRLGNVMRTERVKGQEVLATHPDSATNLGEDCGDCCVADPP